MMDVKTTVEARAAEIARVFRAAGATPLEVLATDRAGELVEGLPTIEFELPRFAVVCAEDVLLMGDEDDDPISAIYDWQWGEGGEDVLKLHAEGLNRSMLTCDGFKTVWKKEDNDA